MWVLTASIYMQITEQLTAELVLGKHAPDGILYHEERLFCHRLTGCGMTLTTRVARVTNILLLIPFVAGKTNLICIDDHHIVTTINMRRVVGLVFAP